MVKIMNKGQNSLIIKIYENKGTIIKIIVILIILAAAVTLYISKSTAEKDNGIIISQADAAAASGTEAGENQGNGEEVFEESGNSQLVDKSGQQYGTSNLENDTIVVDVFGAVNSPMVMIIPAGSRVYEAIEKAGGLTDKADLRTINRAIVLSDGDRLYIPTKEELESKEELPSYVAHDSNTGLSDASGAAKTTSAVKSAGASEQNGNQGTSQSQNGLININTADAQELQKLSGVGPSIADRIITYRNNNGSFKTIDDLKKISGIGAKTFDKFKDKITV
jgi:competence protein ComEA